jgi:hypothetical protein
VNLWLRGRRLETPAWTTTRKEVGHFVDFLERRGGMDRPRAQALADDILAGMLLEVGDHYVSAMQGHVDGIVQLRGELARRYEGIIRHFEGRSGSVPMELPPDLQPAAFKALFDQLNTHLEALDTTAEAFTATSLDSGGILATSRFCARLARPNAPLPSRGRRARTCAGPGTSSARSSGTSVTSSKMTWRSGAGSRRSPTWPAPTRPSPTVLPRNWSRSWRREPGARWRPSPRRQAARARSCWRPARPDSVGHQVRPHRSRRRPASSCTRTPRRSAPRCRSPGSPSNSRPTWWRGTSFPCPSSRTGCSPSNRSAPRAGVQHPRQQPGARRQDGLADRRRLQQEGRESAHPVAATGSSFAAGSTGVPLSSQLRGLPWHRTSGQSFHRRTVSSPGADQAPR